MGSGKVLASVLAGAAAGAILGILFAPDKGSETRRKIAERGTDLAGSLKDKVNEFADGIADKYDSVKEKFTGVAGDAAREKGNSMKADVRNTMTS